LIPQQATPKEDFTWDLSVDGASNMKHSGAGIILEGSGGVLLEQAL